MITYEQINELIGFEAGEFLATTLYLNVNGSNVSKKDYEIKLKDLTKKCKESLQDKDITKAQRKSCENDFKKIGHYVSFEFDRRGQRSLAIFSCSGKGFWQVYSLPRRVKDNLRIDFTFYTRPVSALLDKYKRFCTVVVDRSKARIFEVYLGEIEEHSYIFDEVPSRVKSAGWYGLAEKRISRHIEDHIHRHLKKVSDITFEFFKKRNFDCLILGGNKEFLPVFERHLHSYLQERVAGRIEEVSPDKPVDEILKHSVGIEQEIQKVEEQKLVNRLVNEARSGGLGVYGLEETLKALKLGQVHTLVVSEGYHREGFVCPQCNFVDIVEGDCSYCGVPLEASKDIVEDIIELAYQLNCQVEHIYGARGVDNIGAILRFRM